MKSHFFIVGPNVFQQSKDENNNARHFQGFFESYDHAPRQVLPAVFVKPTNELETYSAADKKDGSNQKYSSSGGYFQRELSSAPSRTIVPEQLAPSNASLETRGTAAHLA